MSVDEVRHQANGLAFRCLAAGDESDPPALLLHGFPEGAESWRPQLEALSAAGFRAVAPDMRGFGGSDCPDGQEAYRMEQLVGDVEGLARQLGAPLHLAGHDWGALVGWSFVGSHPELVRSWASLSVPHPLPLIDASRDDPDQQARSAYVDLFRQVGTAEEILLADGQRRLRAMYRRGPNPDAVPDDVIHSYAVGFARPGRLTAGLNYYRANLSGDAWSRLRPLSNPVQTPTLLIWGDHDPALGRRAVEATAAHMAGQYRLEVLEGAGHWLQFERAETVSRLLASHFASN